jgi:type VI secretion system protein ImpJ
MRRAAEVPAAVLWHDGMLLLPHHFQETSRRFERLLEYHLGSSSPYHFGVSHLEIDQGLLVSGTLRVIELEAVMPDNMVVSHAASDPLLEVDLKAHAAVMRAAPATVFLAVLRENLGRATASGGLEQLSRYRTIEGPPVVDGNTGEGEIAIPRLVPDVRLIVGALPPPRFVSLPIARVQLDGEAFARTDYIPPALTTPLTSPLGKLCSDIVQRLREKALRLADKVSALSMTTDRELIFELRRQIHSLVAALPGFEAVLSTEQAHPYPLFVALAGLVGQLATVARSPVPPVLPSYRHDELRTTFQITKDHVFRMIDEGILESFTAHPFDCEQGRFRLDFLREWRGRSLVLAVRGRRGVAERDVLSWIGTALFGAANKAPEMQASRVLGVGRRPVPRYGDLVATGGSLLFEIEETSSYIESGEPLVVFNTADPTGAAAPGELILYVKATS